MELRRPVSAGTASAEANNLQHEAAMRVQARLDAEEEQRRRAARARTVRTVLSVVLMLGVLGLGAWAWCSGLLDSSLDRKPAPRPDDPPSASGTDVRPETVAPEEKKAPAPVPEKAAGQAAAPAPKAAPEQESGALDAARAKFSGATFDYWKNAVPADRPGKDRVRAFTGLVPDGAGGYSLLEIEMGGGQPFAARRLLSDGGAELLEKADFDKLIADTPYLVVREGRCYFCSAGRGAKPAENRVPPKDGAFSPARAEFGVLVDCMAQAGVRAPTTKFRVSILLEKLKREIPVATVGYGDEVPRDVFMRAVRRLVDDADACETMLAAGKVTVKAVK